MTGTIGDDDVTVKSDGEYRQHLKDTILEWCRAHSHRDEALFIGLLREVPLNNEEIVAVLECIDEVCHHCWDGGTDCQCTNDA